MLFILLKSPLQSRRQLGMMKGIGNPVQDNRRGYHLYC